MSETADPGAASAAPSALPRAAAKPPINSNSFLDTTLVLLVVVILAGVLLGLFLVNVPQANLPIIASLASALLAAVVAGYAGYRWGASDALKKVSSAAASE